MPHLRRLLCVPKVDAGATMKASVDCAAGAAYGSPKIWCGKVYICMLD